ncbi:MAG: anti-sigma factor family protein [Rhodothermales bacterium]
MLALRTFRHWFRRPLNCEDVNRFIVDYLEETIPPRTRARFETHISKCPTCGPYFQQYLQTVELVSEAGTIHPDPPEKLVEATLSFLREHYDGRR